MIHKVSHRVPALFLDSERGRLAAPDPSTDMQSWLAPLAPAARDIRDLSLHLAAGAILSGSGRRLVARVLVPGVLAILGSMPAGADGSLPDLRLATTYGGDVDATTYSGAWHRSAPQWTRADHLEIALGVIDDSRSPRAFVFVGPSWRLGDNGLPPYVEFSFGPTVLTGSTVDGRELGGNFHFRSSLSIGARIGARGDKEIAISVSHISNGGLRSANPGLDSIGLSFAGGIGAR